MYLMSNNIHPVSLTAHPQNVIQLPRSDTPRLSESTTLDYVRTHRAYLRSLVSRAVMHPDCRGVFSGSGDRAVVLELSFGQFTDETLHRIVSSFASLHAAEGRSLVLTEEDLPLFGIYAVQYLKNS